jgi:NAD(P)-dependent dehydrogenase (short-subunit alcohol dehydrogenase family)
LAAGANVIALYLRTTEEFKQSKAQFSPLDVSNELQVADVFELAHSKLGKIDILVNNAGIGLQEGPI